MMVAPAADRMVRMFHDPKRHLPDGVYTRVPMTAEWCRAVRNGDVHLQPEPEPEAPPKRRSAKKSKTRKAKE